MSTTPRRLPSADDLENAELGTSNTRIERVPLTGGGEHEDSSPFVDRLKSMMSKVTSKPIVFSLAIVLILVSAFLFLETEEATTSWNSESTAYHIEHSSGADCKAAVNSAQPSPTALPTLRVMVTYIEKVKVVYVRTDASVGPTPSNTPSKTRTPSSSETPTHSKTASSTIKPVHAEDLWKETDDPRYNRLINVMRSVLLHDSSSERWKINITALHLLEADEYREELRDFDLAPMIDDVQKTGRPSTDVLRAYQDMLVPFIDMPPPAPLRVKKRPTALQPDCGNEKYSYFLTGKQREKPVKVFDLVPFAYELDVLEIRMYELADAVDRFVILESTRTQRAVPKPLFLGRHMTRFDDFRSRLTYLVWDDGGTYRYQNVGQDARDDWRMEVDTRRILWERFMDAHGSEVADDDLIIHGDLDELPKGEIIYQMKHCELQPQYQHAVRLDTLFWRFNFEWVGTNQPMGFPLIFTKEIANNFGPACPRGEKVQQLFHQHVHWAGAHLNRFGNVYLQLYKHLSLAEGGQVPRGDFDVMKDPRKAEPWVANGVRICCPNDHIHRRKDMAASGMGEDALWVPWVATENKERYPYLFPKIR